MDGIGAALNKIKRAFSRGRFHYRYSPYSRTNKLVEFVRANNKPVFIVLLAVIFVGSIYTLSSSITGYVAHTGDIEQELIETEQELETVLAERGECINDLSAKTHELDTCNEKLGDLTTCEEERNVLERDYSILSADYDLCETERVDLQSSYEIKSSDYDALINSSVSFMCCSANEMRSNTVIDWGIVDGRISCESTGYKVECGTGETNY